MASSSLPCFLLLLTLTATAASNLAEPAWEREIADVQDWIEAKFNDGVHAFKDELSASRLAAFASELGVSSPQSMEGVGAAQMLKNLGKEALSEVVQLGEGESEEAGNEGGRREGLLVESSVNLLPAAENADKDLGHYAGYFRLNRTHDARCVARIESVW